MKLKIIAVLLLIAAIVTFMAACKSSTGPTHQGGGEIIEGGGDGGDKGGSEGGSEGDSEGGKEDGEGEGNGTPSDGPPSNGLQGGGKSEPNNQIINGEIYYRDPSTLEQYQDAADERTSADDSGYSDDEIDLIKKYLGIV